MKLTPSSMARRRTAFAPSRSGGGPQMPSPVIRIAPNPSRRISKSPPRVTVPAADASIASRAIACKVPAPPTGETAWLGILLEGEGELHVGPGHRDERARLRRAAVEGGELRVDHRDEVQVAAVEEVGQ